MRKHAIELFRERRTIQELKSLYVKIVQADKDQKPKSIMISSCNEGEGSSTVAVNLSRIFARKTEGGILLIDANLHDGGLETVFHTEKAPGLTNILVGKVSLSGAIRETDVANLEFLPAGRRFSGFRDILYYESISYYLEKLKGSYRFIIIDAPALIPYADSLFLASKVDMVLLVIEAGKTRLEVAQEAIARLAKMNINVFGTILNKKTFNVPTPIYKRF